MTLHWSALSKYRRGVATILLIHGPNLNLLGEREPEIYGTATLGDYVRTVTNVAASVGFEVEHLPTNHEGVIVDAIHAARGRVQAIIINAGAFTHYAWSIHDALATFAGPVIEVHISDPLTREPWRHLSVITPVASQTIAGLGLVGYEQAVAAIVRQIG